MTTRHLGGNAFGNRLVRSRIPKDRSPLFRRPGAYAAKVAISRLRARASRDITVPIGTPVTWAISR
jgi:hypothetical protein